ncbi:MAG: type II toxin-antitoxin system RelE/ParE family toxin [Oscillospiraceae bacterium]|jgi:plasmid stabilization system protein ParE|nr:type II toxin-antitoxin system RelE/ParE family toxin [Oscillospiraceae bacterium]
MRELVILPGAARYLKKLKDKALKAAFRREIDAILEDPTIGEAKTGDLAGVYCRDIFHQRTNYELAYTLVEQDDEVVVVILAGTRENFYEELKRYMKSR